MKLFLICYCIGYCISLFGILIALTHKYSKLYDELLAVKSEQERFQSAIEEFWTYLELHDKVIFEMKTAMDEEHRRTK